MSLDSSLIKQCYKLQFYILERLLIKVCPYAISDVRPRQTIQPIRTKITWTNISVGYTKLIHLIQMRSYKSLNDIPTIHVTLTSTNKWNQTVDVFCVSNAILGQMINGRLKINQFDCLFFANKQSFLLRTSTRSPTCKTTHRTPVWSIERSRMILVISNVF